MYEEEEIININYIEEKKTLAFYFYLDFLIKDNPLLNYSYSFDFIKQINDLQKNNNNNIFEQIIISKIIIDLINNYRNLESKYKNKLNEIENENRALINKNINILENKEKIRFKIDERALLSKKIDMIYIDILISLIKFS